jgi:hypothetical protein
MSTELQKDKLEQFNPTKTKLSTGEQTDKTPSPFQTAIKPVETTQTKINPNTSPHQSPAEFNPKPQKFAFIAKLANI